MHGIYRRASSNAAVDRELTLRIDISDGRVRRFQLGFQPLGIKIDDAEFRLADYYGPDLLIGNIVVKDDHLVLSNVASYGGTVGGKRGFPNIYRPSAANRMQDSIRFSESHLCLVRNGDRTLFHLTLKEDGWHNEWGEHLPKHHGLDEVDSSLLLPGGGLLTIEDQVCDKFWLCHYLSGKLRHAEPLPAWRHGLALRRRDDALFTITDPRAAQKGGQPLGLYRRFGLFGTDELVVPDVWGIGIALIDDGAGGALISQYGQAQRGAFKGVPGALLYIPPSLL